MSKRAGKIAHKRSDRHNPCFGLLNGIDDGGRGTVSHPDNSRPQDDANTRIVRGIQYLECVDICGDPGRMSSLTQYPRRRREAPVCLQSPKTGMIEWLNEIATESYH
jgi:hypothetical protein